MNVDVVYFVESVPKEMDVACIVRHLAAEQHGLRIEIASYKASSPEWLKRTRPKLVVVPTCYAADAWGINKHLGNWPGVPILNLTWEELFCKANLTWKHPRDEFAQRQVLHHVWGDFYKEFLCSHGVPEKHVVVNGNPGYRLYGKPYRSFFPSREELARRHGLDLARRWILLPENYGWAFYGDANMAARVRGGIDPALPAILKEYCRNSLTMVLEWAVECGRMNDVEFIIRPRPTTRLSHFAEVSHELLGRPLDAVRLIKEGTVNEWILASDVVVSSFSTSLLEASIAEKPSYMVEPLPLPDALWSIWYDEADRITSRQGFLDACLSDAKAEDQKLAHWARANLLPHGDPIIGLVSLIKQICAGQLHPPVPPAFEPAVVPSLPRVVRGMLGDSWRGLQRLITERRAVGDQDSKSFGRGDVRCRMKSWRQLLKHSPVQAGSTC